MEQFQHLVTVSDDHVKASMALWCTVVLTRKPLKQCIFVSAENIIYGETFEFTPSFEKIKKFCSEERFEILFTISHLLRFFYFVQMK